MKTKQPQLRTHALLFLFLVVLTTSCVGIFKKKEEPEPELAGVYQMTQVIENGVTYNLPTSTISGNVSVTKPSDTAIRVTLNLTTNGRTASQGPFDVEIRKASGAGYDIYESNSRIGSIDGTNLNVDIEGYDDDGQYTRTVINAKK